MRLKNLNRFYKVHALFYDFTRRFFLFDRGKAVKALDIQDGDVVIDFGCGTGLNTPYLLSTSPKKVIGIDYSEAMLSQARKKFPKFEWICADMSLYEFPDKADKIICTYALSMAENWIDVLENMKLNLKRNGTIVILDFHTWSNSRYFFGLFKWWLALHGVNAEQNIMGFLRDNFENVEEKIMRYGYNQIVVARNAK